MQYRLRLTAAYVLVVAMAGCFVTGIWFQERKHEQAGVPNHHFAVHEGERYFYVPRGGGALEQRPPHPMTAAQYARWEANQQTGAVLAACSFPCLVAAVYLATTADAYRPRC